MGAFQPLAVVVEIGIRLRALLRLTTIDNGPRC